MNRMTQTIITRMSSDDEDFDTFGKKKKETRESASSQTPSRWTRFVSWINSLLSCRLSPSTSKRVKKEIGKIDLKVFLPGSLSGVQDKNWWIIRAANLPVIWITTGTGAPIAALIERLAQVYNFHHVNIGAMLQTEISTGTNRPELGKKLMERGIVIPRRFLYEMIKRNMAKAIKEKDVKGFLFSDFPTTFTQAKAFVSTISDVDYIMVLKFDEHTMKLCAYDQLRRQTQSSKNICKSKSDLKTSLEERLSSYLTYLRSLEQMKGHTMKLIDAELQIREVCRIMMKWIERAMIMHDIKPPQAVEVPVQEHYKYSY